MVTDTPTLPTPSRISNLRREVGISLAALAEAAGISTATLSRKIAGRVAFTVAELALIARKLNVEPSDLFATITAEQMASAA